MTKQPRDASNPKAESVKKTETVQLTPAELRAIAGGAALNPPPPVHQQDVTKPKKP
ncbi:MAG: hypothetical protein ACHRXM_34275 [Isosphaerales bacterium]